jgi:hypothetical protein
LECDELFLSYISNQELKNNILYYNWIEKIKGSIKWL